MTFHAVETHCLWLEFAGGAARDHGLSDPFSFIRLVDSLIEGGEQQLADFLRPIAREPVGELVGRVFTEIDRFAGKAPQYDDITLLIIQRLQSVS